MSHELSNECVFETTQILYNEFRDELNEKKIDDDNLTEFKQKFIKPLYPHKPSSEGGRVEKYDCGDFCCDLDPRKFMCCKTVPPDQQYRDFGLGVCLYVKFLRHLACFLGIVSIFASLSLALYYVIAVDIGFEVVGSYEEFIFSGTTGVLASQFSKCEYSAIDLSAGFNADFSLYCQQGRIDLLGVVLSN